MRSHALGRKLSAKQTEEVPLRWPRAFIVAEARGVAFGEDLFRLAASRQSTFPIGGRLRNALRPASIRVVFKVDDITLWGRYQSQTEPSPATHALGRKLAFAKQMTEEVPLRWLRAFIVAEARGSAFGEDLFRHGFAVPPSPSGEGLGMPFALLLLGMCSKLTALPFGEGARVKQNRPQRL